MHPPAGISTLDRDEHVAFIAENAFDLLVIGGGIMGAGIALEAASRNLKVLLCDKQDFAAGTSSRSTKLIHGGLRYLKNFEIELVRTVASERKMLHRNAPHLVLPERMLIPVLKNTSYGYLATKAGLMLYDLLGNVAEPERHKMLSKKQTLQYEPLLNLENLQGAGYFTEYRTDDGRLTIEVLKTAQNLGAICLNYCEVQEFTYSKKKQINGAVLRENITGKNVTVKARCVINATGPWSATLMQKERPAKLPKLLHTKGVHLVVPFQKLPLRQAVYFDIAGGRMLFAIPRNNVTYLGTTDTVFTGDLENPTVDKTDAEYLIREINQMFPTVNLTSEDVVSSWAGVRVLLLEEGKKPSEISRKDEVFVSETGLISIAGGKLTGYRKLAEQVVNKAIDLNFPENKTTSKTQQIKLAGGDFESAEVVHFFEERCRQIAYLQHYSPEKIAYLVRTYGTNTTPILQQAERLQTEIPDPEKRLLKAEIWYAIHHEGATSLSDFLIRRTGKLYFERDEIPGIVPEVCAAFQEYLSLTDEQMHAQKQAFHLLFEQAVAFKKQA